MGDEVPLPTYEELDLTGFRNESGNIDDITDSQASKPSDYSMCRDLSSDEFRKHGFLILINSILHNYGVAMSYDPNQDAFYPIRTAFRGFPESSMEKMYRGLALWMKTHADELCAEAFEEDNANIHYKEMKKDSLGEKKPNPSKYKTMTVVVDLNNPDPQMCGSYADDAVGMTSGKTSHDWADFFGYKPCLFKDGKVVGYLNPDDYTKFEDGTDADITSGNAGDVMVEFPRRGLKISKNGKVITISMTDDPNNPKFNYYAHQRGSTQKDYFYIGAYLGYNSSSKLRSLSGKSPTDSISLSDCRTYAGNLGSGYMNVGFYQFLFLQCMYLLQYKGNLKSQTVHGYGYCDASEKSNTGATNTKGMMYGSTSTTDHVKLFGIEDFWGNLFWWLDGYYTNSSYHILTATDGFNNTGSGYTDRGTFGGSTGTGGWISNVTGTSETGFTPTSFNGSDTTYFCDDGYFGPGYVPYVGGDWDDITYAGAFQFGVYYYPITVSSYVGGRLGYL